MAAAGAGEASGVPDGADAGAGERTWAGGMPEVVPGAALLTTRTSPTIAGWIRQLYENAPAAGKPNVKWSRPRDAGTSTPEVANVEALVMPGPPAGSGCQCTSSLAGSPQGGFCPAIGWSPAVASQTKT